jgi:GNAT superfamily N-acetyltransferase
MTVGAPVWRGEFTSDALNALHAEAFSHPVLTWDWKAQVDGHSLGWVTVHDGDELVGFTNVVSDGGSHAWIQDVVVAERSRHEGIGTAMVRVAVEQARAADCEWLHVDFDDEHRAFYFDACGFTPTNAGLIEL